MGLYDYVNVGQKIYRSSYPTVSYENIFDCGFGEGIPCMARFGIPGDIWKITNSGFFRTLPLFAPQFTGIKVKFRNFFVPLRILDEDAEEILTGGEDGMSTKSFGAVTITPKKYGFYDYLGVSLVKNSPQNEGSMANYWLRAYRLIYNEWYRDEKLQDELDITTEDDTLFKVNYSRDYFTSAFEDQQLGVAPALPLTGVCPISYTGDYATVLNDDNTAEFYTADTIVYNDDVIKTAGTSGTNATPGRNYPVQKAYSDVNELKYPIMDYGDVGQASQNAQLRAGIPVNIQNQQLFNSYSVNLAKSGGQFDIQDLRRAFAFQAILERNNRAGARYNEFLRANYGISPTDETLQRPVYLGGSSSYINVSEVIQQSATTSDSPLGTQGGKGIGVSSNTIKSYLVKEPGLIMTIMSITPDTMYNSQGIDRQYTYKTRWDFFNPSFQSLGEQAIRNSELYVSATDGENDEIFGYQPMYQELRGSQNVVAGAFRDTLSYWHLARKFDERPNLNSDFIEVDANRDNLGRIFTGTDDTQYKPFYCHIYNKVSVIRPMVKYPIGSGLVQGV